LSIFELFWLFFIAISLWPAIRMRMLEAARLRLLRDLEKKRGSRVIGLIHRQETMALLGFPVFRYINIEDSEEVLRAIKMTDDDVPIDLILHTPGGLVLAAEQIAHALCRHRAKVTIFVPHYAMSGGTLLALAADEIMMDENAVLGPVDPQLGDQPAVSILKVLEQKKIDEIDDRTLILADVSRKAISQVRNTVVEILSYNSQIDAARAEALADLLATGTWTHDYPINVDEAAKMGLPIGTEMPEEVYKLMTLYPQARQQRPSVLYIPTPYPAPSTEKRPKTNF
jgi:ClpP class serine protease